MSSVASLVDLGHTRIVGDLHMLCLLGTLGYRDRGIWTKA